MLFNSLTFLLFFLIVLAMFEMLRSWNARKKLLLLASYLFYAAWNPPYVLVLLLSTGVDWWLARHIARSTAPRRRLFFLCISLAANLGLVAYFKYGNFLLENLVAAAALAGVHFSPVQADILLPIGISFYTFASLSYTVDVYRGELDGRTGLADYALFVSFFPHLVAGPIVRASVLLPQIAHPRRPGANQVGWGLALTIIGLAAKVVLADAILMPVVDRFYAHPGDWGWMQAWIAVFGFSGQIYYDFAGYSLCAIGLAMCFGFAFPDNFHYPYAARGFSDFWRRWHISLSSWLRDYLYIPLGGNRHGVRRTAIALMLTMLIGGLWHGASWMFVLWGGLHGLFLITEARAGRQHPTRPPDGSYLPYHFLVFVAVTLTWIAFRSPSAQVAGNVLSSLAGRAATPSDIIDLPMLLALAAMLATLRWQVFMRDSTLETAFARLGTYGQAALLSVCLIALYLCSGGDQHAFIYFQF